MTYIINAVRSLLAYDRKMKDQVVTSINKIMARHGFAIKWEMDRDRLFRPIVTPMLLPVIDDFPSYDPELAAVKFSIPRHSPRVTSMVQALFDFGSKGYVKVNERKIPQSLHFPEIMRKKPDGVNDWTFEGVNIPSELLDLDYLTFSSDGTDAEA